KRELFVSACGTTTLGEPHMKLRYRRADDGRTEAYKKAVKRQQLVKDYFRNAPAIDVHNHHRQPSLALEDAWKTKKWKHHVFAPILGMTEMDAYLAWRRWVGGHPERNMAHTDFANVVACAL
ncbi:unnamed protein product, partial [Discosporangium mesarthrocarpum]